MFRPVVLFAFVLGSLCGGPPAFALQPLPENKRPNVLFIAVDDMRPELGCYGARAITPNIDRLAKSGIQFNRAYCNQAVCGASRVSLMTGLYPEYTDERTFHVTDWRERWSQVVTLNQHFKQNGYTTVGLGKVYHGSNGPGVDPQNWTRWIKVSGTEYAAAQKAEFRENNGKRRGPSTEGVDTPDETHFDGYRAKEGAEQIRKLAQSETPFFLAVGFTKPHLPFVAPLKYWELYDRNSFSLPTNLGFPPGYPDFARNAGAGEIRAYSDIPLGGSPADFPEDLNKRLLHGYHACVSYTDRNIGVLLDALEDEKITDNTIVVLWADHGWKLGDHTSWCKHTNFECDTLVPLIIRTPNSPSGQTDALAELIDLYPTLCDLCDLDKPEHLQGKSLAMLLSDPSIEHRETAYSSYPHSDKKRAVVGHSIRTKQYRYTEWWDKRSDEVTNAILTDISADPGETTVVQDDELKSELAFLLRKRVLEARQSVGQ